MTKWDCRQCGLRYDKMLTPVEYRKMTFCSEVCKEEYKRCHPRTGEMRSKKKRGPGMGIWYNNGERIT